MKGIGRARIVDLQVRNPRLREMVPADMADKIRGTAIKNYRRIAKYMVIDLDNGLSLIWHMGMSGKVKITEVMPLLEKHDHIIISTDNGVIVYNDPRRFGLFTFAKTADLRNCKFFKNIGVDPFAGELTADYLHKELQRHGKTPIKLSLLNQEIVAGIGNIYASEILYESRISPLRESKDVSLDECQKLVDYTQKVLQRAIDAGGSTLRDYKKPDGSMGYFQMQHCVYNKAGQPCPNCRCDINKTGGIKRMVMGGRSTFYCESLQK